MLVVLTKYSLIIRHFKFLWWWLSLCLLGLGNWFERFILSSYFGGTHIILNVASHEMDRKMGVYIPPPPSNWNENPEHLSRILSLGSLWEERALKIQQGKKQGRIPGMGNGGNGGNSVGSTQSHTWLSATDVCRAWKNSSNEITTAARQERSSACVLTRWGRKVCSQKGFGVVGHWLGRMEKEGRTQVCH